MATNNAANLSVPLSVANGGTGSSTGMPSTSEVTGTSQAMSANIAYIANNASLVTFTLPASSSVGDIFEVSGKGAGGWKIAQNSGQTIYFGTSSSTTGSSGFVSSTQTRDNIRLRCVTANNDFNVIGSIGNITVS